MSDLLNSLGKKDGGTKATGSSSEAQPTETLVGDGSAASLKRGDNLISKSTVPTENVITPPVSTASVTEVPSEDKMVKEPDTWTKDTALKEVVKLREENKVVRTKFQEQLDRIQKETEEKISKIQQEAESASAAKKELEALKAEEEDKKRTIAEKLADRENKLAQLEATFDQKLKEKEREAEAYKSKALQYQAEQEARQQVYKERIKEELDKIPEDLRSFAEKMVKGYEDPHEAWLAISEAQQKGLFGEKKIVVNHSVPGAADGARVNKAQLEADEREKRGKMDSKTLIRAGLDKAMKGQNTAFRPR